MTMQICINGQLSIAMLIDLLEQDLEDLEVIQANTDGITIRIKKTDKSKMHDICKQ